MALISGFEEVNAVDRSDFLFSVSHFRALVFVLLKHDNMK